MRDQHADAASGSVRQVSSVQMSRVVTRIFWHLGMHHVVRRVTKQRRAAIVAKLWRENIFAVLYARDTRFAKRGDDVLQGR